MKTSSEPPHIWPYRTKVGCREPRGTRMRLGSAEHGAFERASHQVKIPSVHVSLIHRLTAALVALCFALFSVEAAVADVHDRDGSWPAATAQGEGATNPTSNGGTQHQVPPAESGHSTHVCHCTHNHTSGSVVDRAAVLVSAVHSLEPELPPTRHMPSRVQEPLVRPPIA